MKIDNVKLSTGSNKDEKMKKNEDNVHDICNTIKQTVGTLGDKGNKQQDRELKEEWLETTQI